MADDEKIKHEFVFQQNRKANVQLCEDIHVGACGAYPSPYLTKKVRAKRGDRANIYVVLDKANDG